MALIIKLKSEWIDRHVHTAFFAGEEEQDLACLGGLMMNIGEWQVLGAALLLGADRMRGVLIAITEGDEEVVRAEAASGQDGER